MFKKAIWPGRLSSKTSQCRIT